MVKRVKGLGAAPSLPPGSPTADSLRPEEAILHGPRYQLKQARILLVDDEATNIQLLRRVLERAGFSKLLDTTDPKQAASLFRAFQPDLVCLDLHMSPLDGFGVLAELELLIPKTTYLPILMLTGDSSVSAKQRALSLGAMDFVTKPFDVSEVLLRINNLLVPRFMHLELAGYAQVLEQQVHERTRALEESRLEVLERLALAAEFRDDETGQHTRRVGRLASMLAERVGVGAADVEVITRVAPLHDIGKIGVPDQILLKPGRLTPDEFQQMQRHASIGAQILSGGRSILIQVAADIAHHHHERWDGSGYPAGLKGDSISLPARIVALADVFDALSHQRPYRDPWPLPEVLAEIQRQSGSHFDPNLVSVFMQLPHAELM